MGQELGFNAQLFHTAQQRPGDAGVQYTAQSARPMGHAGQKDRSV
jgi:hypothetical protein